MPDPIRLIRATQMFLLTGSRWALSAIEDWRGGGRRASRFVTKNSHSDAEGIQSWLIQEAKAHLSELVKRAQ
jgi:hypothetical protein